MASLTHTHTNTLLISHTISRRLRGTIPLVPVRRCPRARDCVTNIYDSRVFSVAVSPTAARACLRTRRFSFNAPAADVYVIDIVLSTRRPFSYSFFEFLSGVKVDYLMGDDITYEEHVALNNMRLNSIRSSLSDVQTFSQACVELTKWCSDQRAFTAHFEDNLMATLQVAMENGTKEAFDFNLTHQLMSACFSHRKHLSKLSANRINRWYEQLRRMKKNGGRRKRAPPKSQAENNNFVMANDETAAIGTPASMWQNPGSSTNPGDPSVMAQQQQQQMQQQPMMSYGQMDGSSASMYEQQQQQQRMMAMRMQQGYPMPMGANHVPGQAQPLMRYPPQYANQQQQQQQQAHYQQMMRARAAAAAAVPIQAPQLGRPQQTPHGLMENVHHPQNPPINNPNIMYDGRLANSIDRLFVYVSERSVIEEFLATPGSHGADFEITHESFNMLLTANYDVLLTVWTPMPCQEPAEIDFFINNNKVLTTNANYKSIFIKQFLTPGKNVFQFGYNSRMPMHRITCEFVCRKSIGELRKYLIDFGEDARVKLDNGRYRYMSHAQSTPMGQVVIPLNCPLSKRRMIVPARHKNCTSPLCVDMAYILAHHPFTTRYYCNLCHQWFRFQDFDIDVYVAQLLMTYQSYLTTAELVLDRNGQTRPIDLDVPMEKEKPKKTTKKRQQQQQQAQQQAQMQAQQQQEETTLKRIKSETFVKSENMYGGDLQQHQTFSPAMPVSVPPNMDGWPKHQSPYGLPSPTKGLGPATPATPSLVMHPASVGSTISSHDAMMTNGGTMAAGSAPYTPASVGSNGSEKSFEITLEIEDLFRYKDVGNIIDNEQLIRQYLNGTKGVVFDNYKCLVSRSLIESINQPILSK